MMNRRSRQDLGVPVKPLLSTVLLVLLACGTFFGQSQETNLQTFHICGTIRNYFDVSVPGAKVTFKGAKFSKTVYADKGGFYETDLPVGLYDMTVQPPEHNLGASRRPLFLVMASTSITLNATLSPAESCDPVMPSPGHTRPPDDGVRMCAGLDSFPVPSEGVPFQLVIQYQTRRIVDNVYAYNVSNRLPDSKMPVFVAYNLFSLQADNVEYDPQSRTLKATGNVIEEGAYGATHNAGSMSFKIGSGEGIPLPAPAAKP
jgi:hypothetical protein